MKSSSGLPNSICKLFELFPINWLSFVFSFSTILSVLSLIVWQPENKLKKNKPVAMFCTGGIRCEKTSVYLKKKGFKNIYQLNGGILNYLKKINKKESLWKGECFVFDNRISLKHGLEIGSYSMCSGCRMPISPKDKRSKKFEEGVSCPNCYDSLTIVQKERFRMRQSQINLAKKAGSKHKFQKEFK